MDHPLSAQINSIQQALVQTSTFAAAAPDLQQAAGWWAYRSRLTQELHQLQAAVDAGAEDHVTPFGAVRRRPGA